MSDTFLGLTKSFRLMFQMATADPRAQDILTCDLCSSPVELYCNPCHVNLCAACSPKHMRTTSSKLHNVVLYKERLLDPVQPECTSHTDQKCIMFCKTCVSPICVKCVTTIHKKHDFIDIEDHILSSMKSIIEADNEELEEAIIPTYEKLHSEIGEKATTLIQEYDGVQANIDKNGIMWHKEIDIVIQKQKTEAQQMKDENLKRLNKHQAEMLDILLLARDVLKRNKYLLKCDNVSQIKNYKSRNEELRTVPQRITWTLPSFTPIRIQGAYLYRQFGKLKDAIQSQIAEFEIKQIIVPEVDIEINVPTVFLHGLSYLPVDKIWIHGKEDKLDLTDFQGNMLDTVKTLSGHKPQGITVTTEGHLIYGDSGTADIDIVRNGERSTIITSHPDWTTSNMCCTVSGDLLVLQCKVDFTCKVVRYGKDYNIKQEIQYDDNGAPLYTAGKNMMYIAENKNTDICVSNLNSKNVVVVNQSGKLRWKYTGSLDSDKYDSFDPCGIATDSQCHVLVAAPSNHCVHVINKDGQFQSFIDGCGLKIPYTLYVDEEDRLFVGENRKSGCKVKIVRYLK